MGSDRFSALEEQARRIEAQRDLAARSLSRRRLRRRSLPPVAAGLSVLTVTGLAGVWADHQLAVSPAAGPVPATGASAQLAADTRALQSVAATLAADDRAIAGLQSALPRAGAAAPGTAAGLPPLPNLPAINIPAAPPVQAVTGASGVP